MSVPRIILNMYESTAWFISLSYSSSPLRRLTLADCIVALFLGFVIMLTCLDFVHYKAASFSSFVIASYYALIYGGKGDIIGCGICFGVMFGSVTALQISPRGGGDHKSTDKASQKSQPKHKPILIETNNKNSPTSSSQTKSEVTSPEHDSKSPVKFRKLRKQSSKIIGISGFFSPKSPNKNDDSSFSETTNDDDKVTTMSMTDYSGSWTQMGPCQNFEPFLKILSAPWPLRKIAFAIKLKQEVVCEQLGLSDNECKVTFTLFKPGPPKVICITPGVKYEMIHDIIKTNQTVLPSWRVIDRKSTSSLGTTTAASEPPGDENGGYKFPPEFCGQGRQVGVLYSEGRDVSTGELGTTIERRLAYLTQEEGSRLFGWTADSFSGGLVMLVLEKYLPSGVDGWNLRIFANLSSSTSRLANQVVSTVSTSPAATPLLNSNGGGGVYEISQIDFEGSWPQMGSCENFENYLTLVKIPWPLKRIMMAVKLKQDITCKLLGDGNYQMSYTLHKPGTPITFDLIAGQSCVLFHDVLKINVNISVHWRVIKEYEEPILKRDDGEDEPYVYPPEFRGKDRQVGVMFCEGRDVTTNALSGSFDRRVAYLTQEEGSRLFGWTADSFSGGLVMLILEKYHVVGKECWNLRYHSNCNSPRVAAWLAASSSSSSSSQTKQELSQQLLNQPAMLHSELTKKRGMEAYGGSWSQIGTCDNFDTFLTLLKTNWALRKIILLIKLKQQITCEPVSGEEGNYSLNFTLFRPGTPIVFTITPGTPANVVNHELLKIDMLSTASWRVIRTFEHPSKTSVKGGFQWPQEFCGKNGRNVAILYCEGRDVKTKELICIFERRVAYITQEEGARLYSTTPDSFKGALVMIMHEQYLPLGVDGWNIRSFAQTSPN